MDIMEQLLCPQISMDVDDTPLDLGAAEGTSQDNNDSDDEDAPSYEEKLKILLDGNYQPAQIPAALTKEEEAAHKTLYDAGPGVQFLKHHCTSCNTHLGSAPINQYNRFVHPLLNVLQCKSCYDFYSSGDFEKDEDGSEMYCRWCGQGGKVMCCSDCAYVFCQKCVRQNLGKKVLDVVKNSDDWKCFGCNPKQIMNLKLFCYALYQFIQFEVSLATQSSDMDSLKIDYSSCCSKQMTRPAMRRKRPSSPDDIYNPEKDTQDPKRKKVQILKKALTSFDKIPPAPAKMKRLTGKGTPSGIINVASNLGAASWVKDQQVVCTPDLPMMGAKGAQSKNFLKVKILPKQTQNVMFVKKPILIAPKQVQPRPIMIAQSSLQPRGRAPMMGGPQRGSQNFIPMNNPNLTITKKTPNKTLVNSLPSKLAPGTNHQWFNQAATITSTITANLNNKLVVFSSEQFNANSVEQLANIHNKLQELLSASVNSLIQVRKNLRNEFLSDLNKMKYSNSNVRVQEAPPPPPIQSDDDVIFINNDEDPLAMTGINEPLPTPAPQLDTAPPTTASSPSPPLIPSAESVTTASSPPPLLPFEKPRSYLKVKSVSSLLNSTNLIGHIEPEKTNGVTEEIDLCDDDDDITVVVPAEEPAEKIIENENVADEGDKIEIPEKVVSVEDEQEKGSTTENEKEDELISTDKLVEEEEAVSKSIETVEPEVDGETYRQIQRALAESKFESILEQNCLIKYDENEMTPKEFKRYISVRVILAPNYKSKKVFSPEKSPATTAPMEVQDFEEMLSGSIVLNTTRQSFDDSFSKFLNEDNTAADDCASIKSTESDKNGKKENRLEIENKDDCISIKSVDSDTENNVVENDNVELQTEEKRLEKEDAEIVAAVDDCGSAEEEKNTEQSETTEKSAKNDSTNTESENMVDSPKIDETSAILSDALQKQLEELESLNKTEFGEKPTTEEPIEELRKELEDLNDFGDIGFDQNLDSLVDGISTDPVTTTDSGIEVDAK